MNDLAALRLYTRVARLGSFSAAAREVGLSQSQVSRTIAELETSVGARLLARTTRAVAPTDAGAEFLARIEPILVALEDAEHAVRDGGELRGTLRVGMPASFGVRVVLPVLAEFTARHPRLHVQLALEDRLQDVVRDGVDVAVRVGGELADATGTSKKLATMPRVVVAAPRYLAGTPALKAPADLANHRIVVGPAAVPAAAWTFMRGGVTATIEVTANVTVTDTNGAIAAATAGLGVTSTTSWACRDELAAGTLVRVLPAWQLAPLTVTAYFPAARRTRGAAREFVAWLGPVMRAMHE